MPQVLASRRNLPDVQPLRVHTHVPNVSNARSSLFLEYSYLPKSVSVRIDFALTKRLFAVLVSFGRRRSSQSDKTKSGIYTF